MGTDIATLKRWFGKGMYPTAEQFAALIDSFVPRGEDGMKMGNVEGLAEALNSRYSGASGAALEGRVTALESEGAAHAAWSSRELGWQRELLEVLESAVLRGWQRLVPDVGDVDDRVESDGEEGDLTRGCRKLDELGEGYSTLLGLARTVKTFLEAEGVADKSIDKWREVVRFLEGIEDTESLAGILAGIQGELTAVAEATEGKVAKVPGMGLVSDGERARWNSTRMLVLDGVCANRGAKPGYGIWAFPEESGVWTVDGDFGSVGMTREDYCDRVGIDMGSYVPKCQRIYICSCYEPKCSRLYYVDMEDGYALKQFVTDKDMPKEWAVEVTNCAINGADSFKATLAADYAGLRGVKAGDSVRLTGNRSYAFSMFGEPHVVTGVSDTGSAIKIQTLHVDDTIMYAMTISVSNVAGNTPSAYIRQI